MSGMCKTDRENYEKYWDDISPFIKYGCLKDQKFQEKMKEYILFKDLDDKFMTMKEYLDTVDSPQPEAEVVEPGEETEEKSHRSRRRRRYIMSRTCSSKVSISICSASRK